MAKFNAYVHVVNDDGERVVFKPGQTAPKWAVEKVGKHCFTEQEEVKQEYAGPGQIASVVSAEKRVAAAQADAEKSAKAAAAAEK